MKAYSVPVTCYIYIYMHPYILTYIWMHVYICMLNISFLNFKSLNNFASNYCDHYFIDRETET